MRSETVWNGGDNSATGGGISNSFCTDYQRSLKLPIGPDPNFNGRGLPDVSAVADPYTGYTVLVQGHWIIVGRTTAVARLYAGPSTCLNARIARTIDFINAEIYTPGDIGLFNDITVGNNSVDK